MATDAELHAAGEFHDPALCPECNHSGPKRGFVGLDGARRVDGPVPVTFVAPDGTTTVMQAESIEWEYEDQNQDHPIEEYFAAARDNLWTLLQPHEVTATIAIEPGDPNIQALQPHPSDDGQVGYFVPVGTDQCPNCGDQNFHESDRLCISCNHDHPEHGPLECRQFCRTTSTRGTT